MNRARTALFGAALLLGSAARLPALGNWTPVVTLDSRIPLEIAPSRQIPPGDTYYQPVLFDLATNSLEIVRVDLTVDPPTASPIVVTVANVFALGAAVQIADRIGFSFVDNLFDLRFGGCDEPCASTFNNLVNAGTWLDSFSAASGDDLYVGAVDNAANNGATIWRSTDNGATWTVLNTLVPPDSGGIYENFDGGKRLNLTVDPTATNPATTRNCLLYETLPSPFTATNIHLNCRDGATNDFDVVVGNDIPNAGGTFDRYIGDVCAIADDGSGGFNNVCLYSDRQTGQVRIVHVDDSGGVTGPVDLAPVPAGTEFFELALTKLSPGYPGVRILFPSGPGTPANDVEWSAEAGDFSRQGPPVDVGPVAENFWYYDSGDVLNGLLIIFAKWSLLVEAPDGGGGLVMSMYRLPIFEDGFETNNALRWDFQAP